MPKKTKTKRDSSAKSKFWFDEDEAKRAVEFCAKFLTHVKGEWAGSPLELATWESDFVRQLFGWKRTSDNTRKYRKALLFIGRKNGKTTLGAAIALYLLFADREPGAEIYSVAADRDQAAIMYEAARGMVENNAELCRRCEIYRRAIVVPSTSSAYHVLSADAPTKHGKNSHGVLFDELHAQPNRELYDVMKTSQGSRRQPLFLMFTTAGFDRHSVCFEEYQYAKQVRDGLIQDDTYLPMIYEVGENADWKDEKVWKLANPGLGTSPKLEFLQEECRRASESAAYQNTFRRLYLNQWCLAPGTLVRMADGRQKRVELLCEGDWIEAYDEDTGKLVRARVKSVQEMPPDELYKITTRRGRSITVSSEHSFWCRTGRPDNRHYRWMPAYKISSQDRILVAIGKAPTPRGTLRLHPEKARFLGIMAGDGTCNGTPRLTASDPEIIAFFKSFVEKMGDRFAPLPDGVHFDARNKTRSTKRTATRRFLQTNGMWRQTCKDKVVPKSVFISGPNAWASFLSGYLDTDGHVSKDGIIWVSVSEALVRGCQDLLAYLGIQSTIESPPVNPPMVSWKPRFRLCVLDSESLKNAASQLDPLTRRKRDQLAVLGSKLGHRLTSVNDARRFDRVKIAEFVGRGRTIGVSVEKYHTHITNGIITHNTEQDTRWIDIAKWDACSERFDPESLRGRRAFLALDLATTTDIAAQCICFPPEDNGSWAFLWRFWVPSENVHKRTVRDRVPYEGWVRSGLIEVTQGDIIDYDIIRQRVLEDVQLYDVQEVVYDRWGATQLITQLQGDGLTCVPYGQGFASMSAPTKEFEKLIIGKLLMHNGNEVARWMMGNVSVRQDPAGNLKPDKSKSSEKIDGIVAAIMALGRAMVSDAVGSVYGNPDPEEFVL